MVTKFRINEAIARANANGVKILKKEVAKRLWENGTEQAQQVNMTKLCSGNVKTIRPEWVGIVCEMCGCTPNYLFGMEN